MTSTIPSTSVAQFSESSDLIATLHALSTKSPNLVKSLVYPALADPSIQVRSWKMNDNRYCDIPSPFPTLARGLFTKEISEEGQQGKRYEILARGYDKFFNVGEVPWTTVGFFLNIFLKSFSNLSLSAILLFVLF